MSHGSELGPLPAVIRKAGWRPKEASLSHSKKVFDLVFKMWEERGEGRRGGVGGNATPLF